MRKPLKNVGRSDRLNTETDLYRQIQNHCSKNTVKSYFRSYRVIKRNRIKKKTTITKKKKFKNENKKRKADKIETNKKKK